MRRVYARPVELVTVHDPGETSRAFARLDEALDEGYAIAGYLAYELGCLWNGVPARPPRDALLRIGIYETASFEPAPAAVTAPPLGAAVADVDPGDYARALGAIARALHEGDAYQVNATVPFRGSFASDPRALFESLVREAGVGYAALVTAAGVAYVSLSPELFLAIDGDVVRTRPMKGTAEPGDVATLALPKNRAEHVMIVDLLRNDLHRICSDVRVEAFATVERYPTFATLTSTIAGRLAPGAGLEAIFAATFPCGSVTGAPKRSAMQTIFETEPTARGVAMGSIGYLEPSEGGRRGWWNVAIRTLEVDRARETVALRVGGGIVADSTADGEWNEIGVKRRLFRALESPVGLIETMCVRHGHVDAEPHLTRLARSAWRLGLTVDLEAVRAQIADTARALDGVALLRLHLAASGAVTLSERAFDPTPDLARCCVAPEPLDARDPLLALKTDRRGAYDDALAFARAHGCFESILVNRDGAVADGSRTSVFFEDPNAGLVTPRLTDGALDGIARRRLLNEGRAVEGRIDATSLHDGMAFLLASASRGVVRTELCATVPSLETTAARRF